MDINESFKMFAYDLIFRLSSSIQVYSNTGSMNININENVKKKLQVKVSYLLQVNICSVSIKRIRKYNLYKEDISMKIKMLVMNAVKKIVKEEIHLTLT